jgi:phage baseplate assembly protein V
MRMSGAALAGRLLLSISRGTLTRVNDATKMQTADVRLLHDEAIAGAERFQDYAFTSVPKPADGTGIAEVVTVFVSGDRSHPIIIRVDDRRYRLKGLQPGESAQYDDQGQQVYISRTGIQILGGPSNLPVTVTVGNSTFVISNGTISATIGGNLMLQATNEFVDLGGTGGTFVKTVAGTSTKVRAL